MEKEAESEKPAAKKPKKPLWKRIVKGLLWFLGGTLVFVLLAVLTLPLWINPVATSVAKSLVPKYTGTAFDIKDVKLNPYTGKMLISGVKLANPEGYAVPDAFTLGTISADVEVTSLLSDTIHVREVTVDALSASWVFDAGGINNIDRIIAAVNEKLGPKEEKEEEPSEKKVVVDKVTVKNVRAFVGTAVFDLESLTLTDFGKDTPAKLEISGVRLTNPPGFGFVATNAFSLASLAVSVETSDLGKLPIKIHDIVIDSPYASYVFDEQNVDNFTRMLEPLLAKSGAAEEEPADKGTAQKDEKEPAASSGSPVTLDRLEVKNLKAHVCNGQFELASLVVTDFGKPTKTLVRLEGAKLVNPDGFERPNAFSLGSLSVALDTADLSKKPMALHDITLKSLYAGYVFNDAGASNIDVMFKPLMEGGKKDGEKGEAAAEDTAEDAKAEASGKGGLPVVVDKVVLEDVHADVGTAAFDLESLNLIDFGKDTPARLEISGVKLTNPSGFEAENAFSLGSLAIDVETGDLGKLPIKIHNIEIDSPYASYVFDEQNVDNFTRMLEPILAKSGAAEEKPKDKGTAQKDEKEPDASSGSPVTLDRLVVKNLKAQVCKGRFELASLVVTDFGKPTNTQVRLEGAKLVNPDGFERPNAFSLGSLSVALDTADLSKKPMALHDITLKSLYAGYVFNDAGASNIDVMFKPLMEGGKKDGEKGEAAVADTAEDEKKKESDKDGLPVVVDKVVLEDVRADIGTEQFKLESLNLVDFGKDTPARLEISGVKLTNPSGFEAENAFSLGSLAIDVETGDLGKLPIKIHNIEIDSPYASYVFDEQNVDNFTRMLEPILAKSGAAEEKPKDKGTAQKDEKEPAASSGSPVTLDRLVVKNLKAQVCKGRFELASLVVTDFGKPTNTQVRLEGAKLVNPDGFEQPNAFSLGSLSVALETADLSKKPMALHDITLKSLYAGYVFNDAGASNIDVMFKPLMEGGKKDGEKGEAAVAGTAEDAKSEASGKGGLPVVIDKVALEDVRADIGTEKFELQSLNLIDLGKDTPAKLEISGVKLTNPPGFVATNAFSLGSLSVSLETTDLSKKPMVLHDIVIDSPYASYVFDEKNVDNFTRMLEPLLAKSGAAEEKPKAKSTAQKDEKEKVESSGTPVTFDRLEVKNLKSHVCNGQFELASLVVTDFGKPTNAVVRLEGAKLVNPDGFERPNAFSLGSLSVALDTADLSKKPMALHDITLKSLYAGYVFNGAGASNIDVMFKPLMEGGKKDGEKGEAAVADTAEDAKAEASGQGGLPVVVDKVVLEDVRADIGTGQFELQSLNLENLGKDTPTKLEISGVKLANPPGFETENAFSLGSLAIGIDMRDLGKLPIKIHDVVIDSPYASYVFDEQNVDNFTRMLEPLLAKSGAAEEKPKDKGTAQKDEKAPDASSGSPVTLDRLEVKNLKAQVCKGRFELASLVVTDFGKPTNAVVRLEGAKLVNPDGFEQPNAFSLGSLSVALETADLTKKPMALHDITLKSLYAGYVFNGAGASNIDVMFKPLMEGGKKDGEKGEAAVADTAENGKKEESNKGGLPVAVDKVVLEDVRADIGTGQFELQSLNLEDLGKDTPTKLEISGVKLANPPGFVATNAFSLGSLSVSLETADLSKKPMVFHDIVIDSPYASYVFDEKNVDNFTRMLEPLLAKDGEAKEKPKEKSEAKKEEKEKVESAGAPVVVGRLEVKNLKSHVCNGQFELASLVVTDFGNSTNTQVRLEGVKLENPDGFSGPDAFSLKSLSVGLETADLSKKPMVFHDIILESPYAGVFVNNDWELNFKALFKPLMGDEKKDGEKKSEGDGKKVVADEKKDEEKKDDEDASRVVIDKLEISGTKIQFDSPIPVLKGTIPIPLPTFKDIGKDSKEGATVKDVGEKVLAEAKAIPGVAPVVEILDKVIRNPSGNMQELLNIDAVKMLGDAKNFLAAGTTNVLGNAKGFVSSGATNVLSGAKDFVSGGATNVLGGAKDFVSGGATNVLGGAKAKLGNAVGSTKALVGGFLPGGDKGDGEKEKTENNKEKKKEDDEPGVQDKPPEESKGFWNKVNPLNLLK